MTPEHALMNSISIWCGEHDYLCFRINVGLFYTERKATGTDEDWIQIGTGLRKCYQQISTGVPKGFSDLFILKDNGHVCFVETKVHPRKATDEQVRFIEAVRKRGFRAGVAYTLEEAIEIIDGSK